MRVLGVDPGTVVTGWGVLDVRGNRLAHVASGTIRAGRGDLGGRLGRIFDELALVIREHGPTAVSLERNFLARNVQSAFRLGEARGVAMAAAATAGVSVSEYTPATIKKSIAGHGRADKRAVQSAVCRLLSLVETPSSDAADALAAAACHAFRGAYDEKVRAAVSAKPRRPARRIRVG